MAGHTISAKLVRQSSRFLMAGMFVLATGICIDFQLIAAVILGGETLAMSAACFLFVVFLCQWFIFPCISAKAPVKEDIPLESETVLRQETHTPNVVIETPQGSRGKYRYDERSGLFELTKIMPAGMEFPYDFGFVPGTKKAEDGDPLDVLVFLDVCIGRLHAALPAPRSH